MIRGLFEAHLPVLDLERSIRFYTGQLGLALGTVDEVRRIAFCFAGGWNTTMVGLWEREPGSIHHQHIAFDISLEDLQSAIAQLKNLGITPLDFHGNPNDVPTVLAWMPSASIYFKDPDGHLLEYLAKLPGAPQPERGIVPWNEWHVA
jgi:lactoylglutathione lyase